MWHVAEYTTLTIFYYNVKSMTVGADHLLHVVCEGRIVLHDGGRTHSRIEIQPGVRKWCVGVRPVPV